MLKGANSTTRSKKSCLTCERRSSSARIRPKDSWCCPSAGSLSGRWRGSTAAADSPRIGRTSIAQRSRSCASPQSGSCSENFVILTDVSGQTLIDKSGASLKSTHIRTGSAGSTSRGCSQLKRCFLNAAHDGRTRSAAHIGFANPHAPANTPPRESIEARTLLFFTKGCVQSP
jgi:hypothetical protein